MVLIVSLFFMWGAANNINDILIRQFQKAFILNNFDASLVQSAFYTGYFCASLPAAFFVRSFGYKTAVIIGLSLFSLGAMFFYPASLNGGWYPGFLGSLYIIAIGLAFLETSGNTWVVLLGNAACEGSGTKMLNIAQSFNPLGSMTGVVLGRLFILTNEISSEKLAKMTPVEQAAAHAQEASQAGVPYLLLALLVAAMAVTIAATSFPSVESQEPLTFAMFWSSMSRLQRHGAFQAGVVAQFFYVAGQVCVQSFIIRFAQEAMPGVTDQHAADLIVVSLMLFMLGRFAASALLSYINENKLLALFAGLSCVSCVTAATIGGTASVVALCMTSFFMSMIFPTVFGVTISKLGHEDTAIGGALLIMSIIGGAVMPAVMGKVSDATSISTSYLVPSCCFLVVAGFAIAVRDCCDAAERKQLIST